MSENPYIRFEHDGKTREIVAGAQVPYLTPGLQDMVETVIRLKRALRQKKTDLNSRLAEIQPLHWEVEVAQAQVKQAEAQVGRLLRLMLPAEEMDRWEGAFHLDSDKRVIVFDPDRRDGV